MQKQSIARASGVFRRFLAEDPPDVRPRDALACPISRWPIRSSASRLISPLPRTCFSEPADRRPGLVQWRRMAREAGEQLARALGIDVDPLSRLGATSHRGRSKPIRSRVCRSPGARIIILDEPTSALSPPEVERLFATRSPGGPATEGMSNRPGSASNSADMHAPGEGQIADHLGRRRHLDQAPSTASAASVHALDGRELGAHLPSRSPCGGWTSSAGLLKDPRSAISGPLERRVQVAHRFPVRLQAPPQRQPGDPVGVRSRRPAPTWRLRCGARHRRARHVYRVDAGQRMRRVGRQLAAGSVVGVQVRRRSNRSARRPDQPGRGGARVAQPCP